MAEFFSEVFTNDLIWGPILINFSAQLLKPFTHWFKIRRIDWHRLYDTGGMPSSHSAMVCALCTGLGLELGFDSPIFAMAVIFSLPVLYDAGGIRRQAGEQAGAINQIVAELLSGHPIQDIKLEEMLGHSRLEVFGGIGYGIVLMLIWKLVILPLL